MSEGQREPRRLRSRNALLLDLPDTCGSLILSDFIGGNASPEGTKTLIRLASSSKRSSRLVYRETPGLWKSIGPPSLSDRTTDPMLASLLRRTNAKEVLETIDLSQCPNISGEGLEPLRGSAVLRHVNLTGRKMSRKTAIGLVESLSFFSDPSARSKGGVKQSGICSFRLPSMAVSWANRKKKRCVGYKESLIGLQKLYREYYDSVKDVPMPCSKCQQPKKVWLHCPSLSTMEVMTYCVKCEDKWAIDSEDEDEDGDDDLVDVGVLECFSCKEDAATDAACTFCVTCSDVGHYWPMVCCSDCQKTKENAYIEECSMCATTNCKGCLGSDVDPQDLAVRKCKACNIKACGICREHGQCEGRACMYVYDDTGRNPWYCTGGTDCDVLKPCAKCGKIRCGRNGCRATCKSCNDAFCCEDGYAYFCMDELRYCDKCKRSFCSKEGCPTVTKCTGWCSDSTCDDCTAEGKGKKLTQCKRCEEYYCDDPDCRKWNRHTDCKKVDPKQKEQMRLMLMMMDAGGSTSAVATLLPSSQKSESSESSEREG